MRPNDGKKGLFATGLNNSLATRAFAAASLVLYLIFANAGALAQSTEPPACSALADSVKQVCCQKSDLTFDRSGALYRLFGTRVRSVTIDNCDGTTTAVRCVYRAEAPRRRIQSQLPDKTVEGAEMQNPPGCKAAWENALRSPDAQFCPRLATLPDCGNTTSISALPYCEDLAALAQPGHCSAWNVQECMRRKHASGFDGLQAQRAERECVSELVQAQGDKATNDMVTNFSTSPSMLGPLTFGSTPPGQTFPLPPGPNQTDLGLANRIVPFFRLEFPGNTFRYTLRTVLQAILTGMQTKFANNAFVVNGVPVAGFCAPAMLSCSLNPLHFVNAKKLVDDNIKKVTTATAVGFKSIDVERTESGWDIGNITYQVGPIDVQWLGKVFLKSERRVEMRLSGPDTQLRILPLHDPRDQNASTRPAKLTPADSQARRLDRAWLAFGVPTDKCIDLRDRVYEDGAIKKRSSNKALGRGGYVTFIQPYKCNCANPGVASQKNYCIFDPTPRAFSNQELKVEEGDASAQIGSIARIGSEVARVYEVFCSRSDLTNSRPAFNFRNGPVRIVGPDNAFNVFKSAMSNGEIDAMLKDIQSFGCMGTVLNQVKSGPTRATEFSADFRDTPYVSSGVGFELETNIDLGKISASVSPSPIFIHVPFDFKIQKAIKKWVAKGGVPWPFDEIISWVLTIVLIIVSIPLTIALSAAVFPSALAMAVIVPTLQLDAGKQHVIIQGVAYAEGAGANQLVNVTSQKIEVRIRRILTKPVQVNVSLGTQLSPAMPVCDSVFGSPNDDDGVLEGIKQFIAKGAACIIELGTKIVETAYYPVKSLLTLLANEILYDFRLQADNALVNAVIKEVGKPEGSSALAKLIQDSLKAEFTLPEMLLTDGAAKAQAAKAQPLLNTICALTSKPAADCVVASLFAYHAETPSIRHMGAKTHYRSMQDYGVSSVEQILKALPNPTNDAQMYYPPVRYCYGGDVPAAGLRDYEDQSNLPLLRSLSDLGEIRQTAAGGPPTDWRTQCALFMDVWMKGHFMFRLSPTSRFDVILAPSARSNFLLNEVFFCVQNDSCDMRLNLDAAFSCLEAGTCNVAQAVATAGKPTLSAGVPPIGIRAGRAICSLMGDIWYRTPAEAAQGKPMHNLLQSGADAKSALTMAVSQSCPINSNCAAQVQVINQTFDATIRKCTPLVASSGLYDPNRTLRLEDVPVALRADVP